MMASSSNDQVCHSFQLISDERKLDVVGIDNLLEKTEVIKSGNSYVVVSIIGPQSSGKSTLINHLFGTKFKEMIASEGRSQTTRGVWMANCPGIEPPTLIMDLEGSDGRERGDQDDTAFEKQLALFSLVSSNIVLLNMFYSSVGLESGASKPLLRIVFQAMIKMTSPNKMTLMFVIRDRSRQMPFDVLERDLKKDIVKLWESVVGSSQTALLYEFFKVEVVALASYDLEKEQFDIDVADLRSKFMNSTSPGGLAYDRKILIPATGLSVAMEESWKTIKNNSDLDIPSLKVLVATTQCEKIFKEMLTRFTANEEWVKIQKFVENRPMQGFGNRVDSLIKTCLIGFNEKANLYDEGVRKAKLMDLETALLQHIRPTWELMTNHIASRTLETFKKDVEKALKRGKKDLKHVTDDCIESANKQFDAGCANAAIPQAKWDTYKFKDALWKILVGHVTFVQGELRKAAEQKAKQEKDELEGKLKATEQKAKQEKDELEGKLKAAEQKAKQEKDELEAKLIAANNEKQGAERTNSILGTVNTHATVSIGMIETNTMANKDDKGKAHVEDKSHDEDAFHVSGPRHVTSYSWNDENYKRAVIACFVQAAYVLEMDRQVKRTQANALAPGWWIPLKYKLNQTLIDPRDKSIYGAILEWGPPETFTGQLVPRRPSGAPAVVLAIRGTLLTPSTTSDLKDNSRIATFGTLEGSPRFTGALDTIKSLISRYGSNNVCVAGHSLGAAFALQVAKVLRDETISVEVRAFNPPSGLIHGITRPFILDITDFVWSVAKWLASRSASQIDKDETDHVPHVYVNTKDKLSSGFSRKPSFDSEKPTLTLVKSKLKNMGLIAKLYTSHVVNQTFIEAHAIAQWWSDDLKLKIEFVYTK